MYNILSISPHRFRTGGILILLGILISTAFSAGAASKAPKSWKITLEEPTGIYRRDNEVVTTRLVFQQGEARPDKLTILDPGGRPVVSQVQLTSAYPDGSIRTACGRTIEPDSAVRLASTKPWVGDVDPATRLLLPIDDRCQRCE